MRDENKEVGAPLSGVMVPVGVVSDIGGFAYLWGNVAVQ